MPANSWSKKFLKILKTFLIFATFFVSILSCLLLLDNFFRIRKISIVSANEIPLIGVEDFRDKNLILISPEDLITSLKDKNPELSTVTIEKKFPSTLIIKISVLEKIANLIVSDGLFSLSDDGIIISKEKKDHSSLPLINYYEKLNYLSYSAGNNIGYKDIKDGLTFIKELKNIGLPVDSLDIKDIDMLLCNIGEKKIIFTSAKDINLQRYQIEQLIKTFKIEGKDYKSIDLRYDKAIVQF